MRYDTHAKNKSIQNARNKKKKKTKLYFNEIQNLYA